MERVICIMKKTVQLVILSFFLSVSNLLVELYPTVKLYLKHFACNIDVNHYINELKQSENLSFLDDTEMEELNKLKEFQKEYCNKIKN